MLNVVNFGGGSYVLYAEVQGDEIDVDPEPYSDNFARPARLLPLEAKALVAAIDLLGDHLPEGSLASAREQDRRRRSARTRRRRACRSRHTDQRRPERRRARSTRRSPTRRLLTLDYYKENEDEFTERTVEPYALINGREGWYVFSYDLEREDTRHFRLDRIKTCEVSTRRVRAAARGRPDCRPRGLAAHRRGAGLAGRAGVDRARARPLGARAARRRRRSSTDGALIAELPFAGVDWLVREVLREAGDAAVLEPEDAAHAVLDAPQAAPASARAPKPPPSTPRARQRHYLGASTTESRAPRSGDGCGRRARSRRDEPSSVRWRRASRAVGEVRDRDAAAATFSARQPWRLALPSRLEPPRPRMRRMLARAHDRRRRPDCCPSVGALTDRIRPARAGRTAPGRRARRPAL